MKEYYPKFLNQNPSFLGLRLSDLALLSIGLILCLVFAIEYHYGIFGVAIFITIKKLVEHFVDVKSLFYISRRETVKVSEMYRKESL